MRVWGVGILFSLPMTFHTDSSTCFARLEGRESWCFLQTGWWVLDIPLPSLEHISSDRTKCRSYPSWHGAFA
jgi:hypothetical protein